eukprot:TRINITY_DN5184_c0_g1_i1.p1 TRINITY_DN5184_c0_g1~~TRINITY_DN5184_c0_g1_i1.p1  ORF type:complete len:278 (+),score=15.34 TRINITY_DN5184_c0_g1_i1:58-891(+)
MELLSVAISGWAGGFGLIGVGQPFDTVKTRLQAFPGKYKGAFDCARQTIKSEGVLALYKGWTGPFMSMGPCYAIYFTTYSVAEKAVRSAFKIDSCNPLPIPLIMMCGGSTAIAGTAILGPAELMKIRQQTASAKGLDGSFGGVFKQVWKEGGIRALYRGAGATLIRDIPASSAWFGAYEITKNTFASDPKNPSIAISVVGGGLAGMGAWLVSLPLDGIKTRLQASSGQKSLLAAAGEIYKEGGLIAFYRGLGPALVRAMPANAACFACKDTVMKLLN